MDELNYLTEREQQLRQELEEIEQRKQLLRKVEVSTYIAEHTEAEAFALPKMVTIREASRQLNVSYNFLYQLCKQDKIKYVMTGKKYLINLQKLCEYLNT